MIRKGTVGRGRWLVAFVALGGCGDDKGAHTETEGASSTGSTTGEATTTSTSTTSTTTTSTSTSTSTTSTSTTSTTTGESTTSSTTTGESTTGGGLPCSPGEACTAVDKACLGLVDNAGKTHFGLRVAELPIAAPAALSVGLLGTSIASAFPLEVSGCNNKGAATANWLLQFDVAAGTLKIGGAKPVPDPTMGYSFVDEMIGALLAQPVSYLGVTPDAEGTFTTPDGADVVLPIYFDQGAAQVLALPLRKLRVTMGTLSASQNCIGDFNDENLDPQAGCQAGDGTPWFLPGGAFTAYIPLEEADAVIVAVVKESLCALLSGDVVTYGVLDPMGNTVCKRTNGVIDFKGDWCAATDTPADPQCADAMRFAADFAANSVTINN